MLDDEESAVVTAGAIVTVTVTLTRSSLGTLLTGDESANKTASNAINCDEEDKENKEGGDGDNQIANQVISIYY